MTEEGLEVGAEALGQVGERGSAFLELTGGKVDEQILLSPQSCFLQWLLSIFFNKERSGLIDRLAGVLDLVEAFIFFPTRHSSEFEKRFPEVVEKIGVTVVDLKADTVRAEEPEALIHLLPVDGTTGPLR